MAVERDRKFSREHPCPICGGWDHQNRGQGTRCFGFVSSDREWAHCTREELAKGLAVEKNGQTYAHRMKGECRCGSTHGEADRKPDPIPANGNGRHEVKRRAWDWPGGLRTVRADYSDGEKRIWQEHPEGETWKPGRAGAPYTLLYTEEVEPAPPSAFVFLVEGEKCADAVRDLGFVATTWQEGAKGWASPDSPVAQTAPWASRVLKGKHVVVCEDNDEPGREISKWWLEHLRDHAADVRLVSFRDKPKGYDVADWLAEGHEGEDLVRLAENQAVMPRDGIEWLSTSRIFEPLPPTPWLIRDLLLCPGRPSMIAGYGYAGKTLVSQSAILSCATGREVWGKFATGKPVKVRHLDFDQGQHATRKRYQRLLAGMDILIEELGDRLELAVFPDCYLNAPNAVDAYSRVSEGCGLVLLDALRGATPGEDENDSKISACLYMLARVSEKTGAVFLVDHHAGKPKEGHQDARTVPRGSSGIFGASGSVFVISGQKGEPKLVEQVKAPAEADGGAIENFYLRVEDVPIGGDARGGVRVMYQAMHAAVRASADQVGLFEAIKKEIVAVVRTNPGLKSANAIEARLKLGHRTKRLQAIRELGDDHRIVVVGGIFHVAPT